MSNMENLSGYGLELPTADEARNKFDSITQEAVEFINNTIAPSIKKVYTKSNHVDVKLVNEYYVGNYFSGLGMKDDKKKISEKITDILTSDTYGYNVIANVETGGDERMNGHGVYVISWGNN